MEIILFLICTDYIYDASLLLCVRIIFYPPLLHVTRPIEWIKNRGVTVPLLYISWVYWRSNI